jgi:hypothetical protein
VIAPEVLELAERLLDLLGDHVRSIAREEFAALQPPARKYMPLAEAAQALALTPAATRMRWKRGRLDGCTDGRHVYISVESVRRAGGDV